MKSYTFSVQPNDVSAILERVAGFPWHEMPTDADWQYGTNLEYMQSLCDYWVNGYDWFAPAASKLSNASDSDKLNGYWQVNLRA